MSNETRFLTAEEQIAIIEALRRSATPVPSIDRDAIIEECAKVLQEKLSSIGDIRPDHVKSAIAAIRALKDKL